MFVNSLNVYKIIFMAELLIAEFLFTFCLQKKSKFPLRFAAMSAVCMCAAVFFPVFYYNAIYSSALFLFLFCVSVGGLMFCYRERPLKIVFCALAAYTVRHFSFQLFSLYITFVDGNNTSVSGIYGNSAESLIFDGSFYLSLFSFIACYFIVYTLCYTLFGRRLGKNRSLELRKPYLLILVVLILFIDIVLNAIVVYNSVEENFLNGAVLYTNVIVLYVYNILCCLFTLFIQFAMIDMNRLKKDLEIVNHLWQQAREQYEISRENIEMINLKCHDLKYQIRQFAQGGSVEPAAVEEIENMISIYDSMVKTGNEALDVIFTEKSLICRKNNIKLICMADGGKLSFMDKSDIYILFGNLMDNAIEAVQKLDNTEERIISLNVCRTDPVVAVNIRNYYSGDIVLRQDGLPVTTKGDENFHGLGMRSISLIVEKYNGNIDFTAENRIFTVDIVFPVPKEC